MNSCILMAEIIQQPQLRYTPDNQLEIAEMLVQFPGQKPEDPPEHLKVIGWGNFAREIHEKYREGDRVIVEGRLGMNTIERDGIKEKRAELTAVRIYRLGADSIDYVSVSEPPQNRASVPTAAPNNVVSMSSHNRSANSAPAPANRSSGSDWNSQPLNYESDRSSSSSNEPENPDYDPIPF
jgi:single-strand DNA-binding protein